MPLSVDMKMYERYDDFYIHRFLDFWEKYAIAVKKYTGVRCFFSLGRPIQDAEGIETWFQPAPHFLDQTEPGPGTRDSWRPKPLYLLAAKELYRH